MMLFAGIVFVLTLTLILLLFVIKIREERTGRVLAPRWRTALDQEALHIKDLLHAAEVDLKKVPPILVYWSHAALHVAALEFARATRAASREAHALADLVSRKRMQRREVTGSEFLKRVSERKNRGNRENGQDEFNA